MKNTVVQPIIASYRCAPGPQADHNPLVLALPAAKSDEEWLEQLAIEPAFDETQRADAAYLRSYYVTGLKQFFVPAERGKRVARSFDLLIREGLASRHPLNGEHFRLLQREYTHAQEKGVARPMRFTTTQPICSYSVIGVSGMGKTTTVESVLAAYPQYILHRDYDIHQIVWLKAECPKDGSVKELALNVLRAFDEVLGTSHAPRITNRVTLDNLTPLIKHLARSHFLGVLVLDELQNVSVRKSNGREELMNWFQELVNELKLPLVLLGTPKALTVMQLDARHSRRAGIMGGENWRPLLRGPEFDLLLETLWQFQWLREPGELTEAFKKMVFDETQGVIAFIVDMFLVCQLHALRNEKETLTPDMFKKVARTEFEFLQPLLNALRSKQPMRMAKFHDIEAYDVDEIIDKHKQLIPQPAASNTNGAPGTSLLGRASAAVRMALGLSDADARRLVGSVLTSAHKSHVSLTQDALRAWAAAQTDSEEAPSANVA